MPFMSLFIERSCSCCWEFSANHFTRSSMLERNNFSRWEIEHFLNPPPMIRIKHFSKKIRLQAMMMIHLKQKTWQVETSWNNQFFQSMWHSSHSNFEIEILKPVFFSGPHQLDFSVLFPCHFSNSIRIWQPKNMFSFKVVDPAQLKKNKVQKTIICQSGSSPTVRDLGD